MAMLPVAQSSEEGRDRRGGRPYGEKGARAEGRPANGRREPEVAAGI